MALHARTLALPLTALALAGAGCGGDDAAPDPASAPGTSTPIVDGTGGDGGGAPADDSARFTLYDLSDGATVHGSPGGPVTKELGGSTDLGSPTWVWALETRASGWARVVLPGPPGATGWVQTRGRLSYASDTWLKVDVSERTIAVMDDDRTVASFPTAVGRSEAPTPTGRFSVTDLVQTGDPGGPYGWFAFGLSGRQRKLPAGWTGGTQLAIHGTNDPSSVGQAVSAGCMRVDNSALRTLRKRLRLGTPVVINA